MTPALETDSSSFIPVIPHNNAPLLAGASDDLFVTMIRTYYPGLVCLPIALPMGRPYTALSANLTLMTLALVTGVLGFAMSDY